MNYFTRSFILLITLYLPLRILAQNQSPEKNIAIIKGYIKNNTEELFDFMQPGYFNNPLYSVPIEKDGSFSKKIEFDSEIQDLYFSINGLTLSVYVENNDTIDINWDVKDIGNSLSIKSNKKARNQILQTLLGLTKLYGSEYINLYKLDRDKLSDSAKFEAINYLYNKEIVSLYNFIDEGKRSLVADPSKIAISTDIYFSTIKIATDIYYRYTRLLMAYKLFPSHELLIINPTDNIKTFPLLVKKEEYKMLSESAFKTSRTYRDFLFDYMRFYSDPFISYVTTYKPGQIRTDKTSGFTPVWDNYYRGCANLKIYEIRDWFITAIIINGFQHHSFDEATAVYEEFRSHVKIKQFADTLKEFYDNALKLKPGNIAPAFTLKDPAGKSVCLKDFKGQIVYIDFWGVYCGPCIIQIKKYFPQLHDKYKDRNIVFLNICVDADEIKWKESLLKLNLSGINLIAEGWTKNPVLKTYGISYIPHYMIIDADGTIVDNNASSPSMTTSLYQKLDKLLMK